VGSERLEVGNLSFGEFLRLGSMELLLAEHSATLYMLPNLFHATAQANAEGKHLLAESMLTVKNQPVSR